jgi:hypothetical protein
MRDDVNVPGTPLTETDYIELIDSVAKVFPVFVKPPHRYGAYSSGKFLGMHPRLFIVDETVSCKADSGT